MRNDRAMNRVILKDIVKVVSLVPCEHAQRRSVESCEDISSSQVLEGTAGMVEGRRLDVGRRLSPRVACRRWAGVSKSCTAGADSALRRIWERGKLV